MTTQKVQNIIWSFVGIAVLGWIGWSVLKPVFKNSATNNENSNTNVSVADTALAKLKEQYNASTNWFDEKSYSIQFQNDLTSGSKTIAYRGVIDDVYKKGPDTHIKTSISSYETNLAGSESVYIDLVCNSQAVLNKIQSQKASHFQILSDWVVVANISTFRKTSLKVEPLNDDDSGDSYLSLDSPDAFLGTGSCVDVEYVGN